MHEEQTVMRKLLVEAGLVANQLLVGIRKSSEEISPAMWVNGM